MAGPVLGVLQVVEQPAGGRPDELGLLDERAALGGDAPDPPPGVVATGVAEVDLAVLDDRVVPVGDVHGAVGAHLDVDGPEGRVSRRDEVGQVLARVAGAVVGEGEAADVVGAEVVGEDVPPPVLGQVPAAEDLGPAILGTAGVEAGHDPLGAGGGVVRGARQDVVDPLPPRAVGHERLAPAVEVVAPGVPPAPGEDVEPLGFGPELPDAPAAQATDPPGGLDVAVDVDRLVEVEHPVGAPPQCMEDVMGVLGAEAGEDDLARVGLAVAVEVGQVEQLGAVGDVGAAVARLDPGGDQELVGEDGGLVGLAVVVGVLEDHDLVVGHLARLDLGVDLGAGDPKPPEGVEVHLDRLGQQRVGGEEVDLEPLGHLERGALGLGVGVDDRHVLLERDQPPEADRPGEDQGLAEPSPPGGQFPPELRAGGRGRAHPAPAEEVGAADAARGAAGGRVGGVLRQGRHLPTSPSRISS